MLYCHKRKRLYAYALRAGFIVVIFSLSLSVKYIYKVEENVPESRYKISENDAILNDGRLQNPNYKILYLDDSPPENLAHESPHRKLLGFSAVYVIANASEGRPLLDFFNVKNDSLNGTDPKDIFICTEPAYHEFPPDAFTTEQRLQGAMAVHILVVLYMFIALAVVCDVYFVASLEKICEKLNLSDDVAGATFMAAGSSAPELFTSIIGVFIAHGDVGVGTIVGSAVFNILFVIGLCGVLVNQPTPLTWWPLGRDSVFYIMSVILLIGSISNGQVSWVESFIMIVLYVIYIVVMKFNQRLQTMALDKFKSVKQPVDDRSAILPANAKVKYYTDYEQFREDKNGKKTTQKPLEPVIHVDSYVHDYRTKLSFEDACYRFLKTRRFSPLTRFRAATYIIILERRKLMQDTVLKNQYVLIDDISPIGKDGEKYEDMGGDADKEAGAPWKSIPSMESDGLLSVCKWVFLSPISIVLFFTVPDCSKDRWSRWFMVTFIMSIVWIAAFSYVMVWMVAVLGFTIGIPDSIMGITFLAAGTSVPDAMASVLVARQGQGDMAVSNTMGSNVFDICIGLALPWFIQTSMVSAGSTVHINSNGIVFSVVLLFLTVIVTLVTVHMVGWVLNKRLGVVCLTSYVFFLTFSIMIEFNVFGYVNPPMCPEH